MTIDPLEKASMKMIERAVDGLASFFGSICMPAAEELGLLVQDQVRFYRVKNLLKIKEKIEVLTKAEPSKNINLSPKFLKAVIEDSSWAEKGPEKGSSLRLTHLLLVCYTHPHESTTPYRIS